MIDVQARKPRSVVDGVLLLDKPPGVTSQQAVARVKGLFNAAKAGHTGTLDPMATGLLPIALGEATKFSSALLDADKTYLGTVRLGQTTTTGDLEGETTRTCPVTATLADVEAVLPQFTGEIWQTPPMYSALKRAGKPLYEYARQGAEFPREPRRIRIGELRIEGQEGPELRLAVSCSKGTYIRVLAEDIGATLGCGGCLSALRRTRVGNLDIADAITLDALGKLDEGQRLARLLPVDSMLADLPVVEIEPEQAQRLTMGMAVRAAAAPKSGLVRVYARGPGFLGIAEACAGGELQPRRLMASQPQILRKHPSTE